MPVMPEPSPTVNPDVYLNYLPPEYATQFEIARNIYLVSLGGLFMDILISLPEDITLLKAGIGLTTFAYFLTRASGLAYVLLCVIFKTTPGLNCAAAQLAIGLCWVTSSASFSFLFLRRAHAIFHNRRIWKHFYSCLFVVNVGASVVVPIGNRAGPLGPTRFCINTQLPPYVCVAIFSRLLYDSCVFLGISYELVARYKSTGASLTFRSFFTGHASSKMVKSLLRGGQQYYLLSVCSAIVMSFLIVSPGIYELDLTVPYIYLSTVISCRVFRSLRNSVNQTSIIPLTRSLEFQPSNAPGINITDSTVANSASLPTRDELKPSSSCDLKDSVPEKL